MNKKVFISSVAIASVAALTAALTKKKEKSIVKTKRTYTYDLMVKDLHKLYKEFPHILNIESLGKTTFERDIWAVRMGKGNINLFFNGSHHAREWMSTMLLMKMIETYAKRYEDGNEFEGYDVRELLHKVTIWFIPMVNPDGVELQQNGLRSFPKKYRSELIKMNEGSTDFKRWKANAQGIDLNRQYPADWANIKNSSKEPHWGHYKGLYPLQASEAKIVVDFVKRIQPEVAVSYHSSGRVLFWNFNTKPENMKRDTKLALMFSRITKYRLIPPMDNPSGGGFNDWFLQEFERPGVTPELGEYVGNTHLPLHVFPEEWERNKKIGLWLSTEAIQLWNARNKIDLAFMSKLEKEYEAAKDEFLNGGNLDKVLSANEELLSLYSKLGLGEKCEWLRYEVEQFHELK